ncbi:MAG: SxtJ family membrane protein, partial [bacterium]|nr:SxtJ family membrane protein [bacterium]
VWIQPAAGDAAGAMGAALLVWHRRLENPRPQRTRDGRKGTRLGPAYGDDEIASFLERKGIPFRKLSREELPDVAAQLLAEGKVVGWFQGRMEFGPRALGSRSILADPRLQGMQSLINRKIKFRESFRPFAPTVLREHATEWFEMDMESPYMSFTFPVRAEKRCAPRSVIPAVTHVDGSSRVQTLAREDDPLYYDLIDAFHRRTGCPVVVNTSFNVRGEPIVCTPEEAAACFMNTGMDHLVLGSFLLDKRDMPPVNPGSDGGNMGRISPEDPPRGDTLKFSAALAVVLEGIAAMQLWRGRTGLAIALGIVGTVPLALGFLLPGAMRLVQRGFTRLAMGIGRINTRLLLGLIFFLILTPAAVFLRLFRPDALRLTFEPGAGSYWVTKPGAQWRADRYDRMY